MQPFDEYVALGDRCEVAFQLRRVLGKENVFSSFFNWNVTSIDSLVTLLSTRFDGILRVANLRAANSMVHDSVGQYSFHLTGEAHGSKDHPAFSGDLDRHREKTSHMIREFFDLAESRKRVCYFYRCELPVDFKEKALQVCNLLLDARRGDRNFALVCVQPENVGGLQFDEDMLHRRFVKRLAPYDDQSDAHIASWDAIFREFPHVKPLRLCDWS